MFWGLRKADIRQSARPPVIVLQGDHGWGNSAPPRMRLLNANDMPDGGGEMVYATNTPVNAFRIIFTFYFGANYPMLEDLSYFSPAETRYQFTVYPPICIEP